MMRNLLGLSLIAPLALVACGVPRTADLTRNSALYADVDYECKLPGDRTVFIAPLVDARSTDVLPAALGGYPMAYDDDSRWQRPVPEMLDELLRREVEATTVFSAVVDKPGDADVVLMPSLVTFAAAAVEHESGGRSLVEVAVRLRVFGPVPEVGDRPLLLDDVWGDRQVSPVAFRTPSRHVLAGIAVRNTLHRLLAGLDGKNVGRNHMPAATPESLPRIDTPMGPPAPPVDR